ncbi:MAG: universal stress protein [Thermomicrobiales bacterium]|nr:universal stress protein [Thermomicrobiales bacterium]
MNPSLLVPLDGSPEAEQALPYAQALLPSGGQIRLFRVVPGLEMLLANEPALTELQWVLAPAPEATRNADLSAVQADLDRIGARIGDSQVTWSAEVVEGDPATQLLQAIARRGVDLVVMTTHGRGALGRAVFGSVADRVVRTSPVPVLLVRPTAADQAPATATIRRLLVPLDGSVLAEAALTLARRLQIPVHLVRATNTAMVLATLSSGPFPVAPPADIYDRLTTDLEGAAATYLNDVATRLQGEGLAATWEVRGGSPYDEIADASQPGDLLVLTSHGRGGVMRWLLGSVAEKLVREAPVPVLLVPAANRGDDAVGSGG